MTFYAVLAVALLFGALLPWAMMMGLLSTIALLWAVRVEGNPPRTIAADIKRESEATSLDRQAYGRTGTGTVATNPIGVSFAGGTVTTMTATPDPGSPLIGWTGAARAPRAPVLFWYSLQKVKYGEDPSC